MTISSSMSMIWSKHRKRNAARWRTRGLTEELWDATEILHDSIHFIFFNIQTAVASQIVDWSKSNNDKDKWTKVQLWPVKQQMDNSPRASSVLKPSSSARENSNNPMGKRNLEEKYSLMDIYRCGLDRWRSIWRYSVRLHAVISEATPFFKGQVRFNRKMCVIWSLWDGALKNFPKSQTCSLCIKERWKRSVNTELEFWNFRKKLTSGRR